MQHLDEDNHDIHDISGIDGNSCRGGTETGCNTTTMGRQARKDLSLDEYVYVTFSTVRSEFISG